MKKSSVSIVFLSIILFIAILSGVWTFLLKDSINSIRDDLRSNKEFVTQKNLLIWLLDNKLDSLGDAAILIKSDQPELSEKLQAYISKQKRVVNNIPTSTESPSDEFILEDLVAHPEEVENIDFTKPRKLSKAEEEESSLNENELAEVLSSASIETDYLNFKIGRNNVYYDGNIKNGKAEGVGKGLFDNGVTYEGAWRNNLPDGEGVQKWPDGRKYEGHFSSGLKSGTGTFIWNNHEKYVGEWLNDQRHGKGTLYDKKGKVKYKGEWRSNIFLK